MLLVGSASTLVGRHVQLVGSSSSSRVQRGSALPALQLRGTRAAPSSSALQFLEDVGLNGQIIASAALHNPGLEGLDVHAKVEPTLQFLRDLGFTTADFQKMLIKYPRLFNISLDGKLKPAVGFLLGMGFEEHDVREICTRFPHVLSYGVKSHLKPQLAYLASLGVPQARLRHLVLRRPAVLGAGIESLVKYLMRQAGLRRTDIGAVLATFPYDFSIPLPQLEIPKVNTGDEDTPGPR